MARTGDVKVEVGFDRASREAIRSLVAAIDGLAKALNSGKKVDNALLSEPVVKRLVEDVQAKPKRKYQSVPPPQPPPAPKTNRPWGGY